MFECATCGKRIRLAGAYGRHVQAHERLVPRFWSRVDKTEGCWNWKGRLGHDGYGLFSIGKRDNVIPHRFSYELEVGPIPEGLQLDHLCRNRACVRPDHLEPVTREENMRRAKEARVDQPCPHCSFVSDFPSALSSHIRHKHPEAYRSRAAVSFGSDDT